MGAKLSTVILLLVLVISACAVALLITRSYSLRTALPAVEQGLLHGVERSEPARVLILYLARAENIHLSAWIRTLRRSLPVGYGCWAVCNSRPTEEMDCNLWVADDVCREQNVTHMTCTCGTDVTAWDKGFLCAEVLDYDFTWFLEDDVFVLDGETFTTADASHPKADLLHAPPTKKLERIPPDGEWWWHQIYLKDGTPIFPLPWFESGCKAQALRASRQMLKAARRHFDHGYAPGNMIEYMWYTVAYHDGLQIQHPTQLVGSLQCDEWHHADIISHLQDKGGAFFHAVKSPEKMASLRNKT